MSGDDRREETVQRSRLELLVGLSVASAGGGRVDDSSGVTAEDELLQTHAHTMWNTGSFPSPYRNERGRRYEISRDQRGYYSYRKTYPGGASKSIGEAEYDAAAKVRDSAEKKPAEPLPDPARGGEGGGGGGAD